MVTDPGIQVISFTGSTAAGRRVATGLSFPFNQTGVAANGQERWGGDISIAVDPRSSSTVYVAFATLALYMIGLVLLPRPLPPGTVAIVAARAPKSGLSQGARVPIRPQRTQRQILGMKAARMP